MSMWELEALAEQSVLLVGASDLPAARKRQLFASIYDMVEVFDVSFVHFRTVKPLVDAQFFFRIDLAAHPEFAKRKTELEAIEAAGRDHWLTDAANEPEAYYMAKSTNQFDPGIWFDTRMAMWQKAVDAGLLTGDATKPVDTLGRIPTLVALLELALAKPLENAQIIKMLHGFVAWPLGEQLVAGDERLAPIRKHPGLAEALDQPHVDWVQERFDAKTFLEWAESDDGIEFLQWWSAVE